MQLLYIWIEDFKNIKKQGFNLSSKYSFHFDEENEILTVEKNKFTLPENFYADNIQNITAIVGKNGSGKSNFIETLIHDFISNKDIKNRLHSQLFIGIEDNILFVAVNEKYKKFKFKNNNLSYIRYWIENNSEIYHFEKIEDGVLPVEMGNFIAQKNSVIYFSNIFDRKSIGAHSSGIYTTIFSDDYSVFDKEGLINISTSGFLKQTNKKTQDKGKFVENYLLEQSYIYTNFFISDNEFEFFDKPKKINVFFPNKSDQYKNEIGEKYYKFGLEAGKSNSRFAKEEFSKYIKIQENRNNGTLKKATNVFYQIFDIEDYNLPYFVMFSDYRFATKKKFPEIENDIAESLCYFLLPFVYDTETYFDYLPFDFGIDEEEEFQPLNEELFNPNIRPLDVLLNIINEIFKPIKKEADFFNRFIEFICFLKDVIDSKDRQVVEIIPEYKKTENESRYDKLNHNFLREISKHHEGEIQLKNEKKETYKGLELNLKEIKKLIAIYSKTIEKGHYLLFDYDESFKYSSGEEFFLNLFSRFYYAQQNNELKENVIILLDEAETTLHPEWQRTFLKTTINFLSELFKYHQLQIIFTTHSPFVLSDLPNENIIFLNSNKEGICNVVANSIKKKTFAANIHTLLSDSFFLENGVIGEIAKSELQEIINYLNDKQSKYSTNDKDRIKTIIEMIGEEFLKDKLRNMFFEKHPEEKLNEIEQLKRRIEKLEND